VQCIGHCCCQNVISSWMEPQRVWRKPRFWRGLFEKKQ
jgi:hypothetical protein